MQSTRKSDKLASCSNGEAGRLTIGSSHSAEHKKCMRWPPRKRRLILRLVVVRSGDKRAPYFTCSAARNRCIYNLRSGLVTRYGLGAAASPYRQRHLLRCTTIRCKKWHQGLAEIFGCISAAKADCSAPREWFSAAASATNSTTETPPVAALGI